METHVVSVHTHTHSLDAFGYFCQRSTLSTPQSPTSLVSLRQRVPSVSCMSIQYGCWHWFNFIITFPRLTTRAALRPSKLTGRECEIGPLCAPTDETRWEQLKGVRAEREEVAKSNTQRFWSQVKPKATTLSIKSEIHSSHLRLTLRYIFSIDTQYWYLQYLNI